MDKVRRFITKKRHGKWDVAFRLTAGAATKVALLLLMYHLL
jgi:hypothetical protein